MTYAEYLKSLTKNQRRYLSRRSCAWCETPLSRADCGAIYDGCTDKNRIARANRCLKGFKPRAAAVNKT